MSERRLIEAARRGDEAAFQALVAPQRGPLHAHCQRMLGSAHDAEDAMQETMLRAWRALPTFEGRSSLNSWLYRIATNTCLTALAKRPQRVVPLHHEVGDELGEEWPLDGEPNPTEADYERQEAAALAFTVTLQHLPAKQRAALILRDVLGYRASEAASTLGTTVASVNSALQRARGVVVDRAEPDGGVGDERLDDAVEGCVRALARGDVDTLIGIAADTTPPAERSWSYSPLAAY
jgi:RNA polymerase sigma-70 factor (ECF subfamily)